MDKEIKALYDKAKSASEFEFACLLLRIRGMEDIGWDSLVEVERLRNDFVSLLDSPLRDDTKLRLLFTLYVRIIESNDFLEIPFNLMRLIRGERYNAFPFIRLNKPSKNSSLRNIPASLGRKLNYLVETYKSDFPSVIAKFEQATDISLRNAISHSDYTTFGDEFRSRDSLFQIKPGLFAHAIPLAEVIKKIELALKVFNTMTFLHSRYRRSYKKNKIVLGLLHGDNQPAIKVELQANAKGLYGFRSPPGNRN